jgi:cytochrome o ubiquinol oxidase subunit 2
MAGQIYAMPGMETKLHAVINRAGDYEGFSANYSGAGFSGMRFKLHGLDAAGFEQWIGKIKNAGGMLDRQHYLELERPSENVPVKTFAGVDPTLFDAAINQCVQPGKMCLREMAMIDAEGGLGLAGIGNVLPLEYDKHARRGTAFGMKSTALAAICDIDGKPVETAGASLPLFLPESEPVTGAGLPAPTGFLLRTELPRPSNS